MPLLITKGFKRRRDYEARQELGIEEERRNQEQSASNPERSLEEQTAPDREKIESGPPVILRIWRALWRR